MMSQFIELDNWYYEKKFMGSYRSCIKFGIIWGIFGYQSSANKIKTNYLKRNHYYSSPSASHDSIIKNKYWGS